MPALALHAAIAKRIADQIRYPVLDAEPGSLYLGATAPDIHILMRWDRKRTHFFDLKDLEEQSAVAAMFEAHPSLAYPAKLSPSAVAFVCGYISHLVMDEVWINDVYRPFFGRSSPMADDSRADIMDRAIQYDLDRQARTDRRVMLQIVKEIARPAPKLDVGMIEGNALSLWQGMMVESLNHPPDWKRFRFFGGRALMAAGIDTPQTFAEFVETLPVLVAEAIDYLGRERVEAFLEKSVDQGGEAIKEYLD
jgi:hypothetical protein